MLSGNLLPAHPKPLPDEILSSWFARVAEANGVKQHTLAFLKLNAKKPPWFLALDVEGGEWFSNALCDVTGTPRKRGQQTTLSDYSGITHPPQSRGNNRLWVLPNKSAAHNFQTDGIQFCPQCLSEGMEPYYRRQWRLAFYTFCPIHNTMMYDACPWCESPVAYHRRDIGVDTEKAYSISQCFHCGNDFRDAQQIPPNNYQPALSEFYKEVLMELHSGHTNRFDLPFYLVLHQLCMIMVSSRNKRQLYKHICSHLGISTRAIEYRRSPFVCRTLKTRYHIISLALWLLMAPAQRLTEAWQAGAVRYATLIKDFPNAPSWYLKFTSQINRQKAKLRNTDKKNFESAK